MKRFLFCVLLSPLMLWSQTNESEMDSLKVKASLSLTGLWQGGNVETLIFRAKSDVSFKPWDKWVFKTKNSYVYQEFGREKADEDILSLNFLYINPDRKFYPLILGFFSTNFRREIDARYLVGGGVSYQVFKKDKNWLKMSLTSEFERTDFDSSTFNITEYNGMQTVSTLRGTFWLNGKYYLFKDKMILTHESYFQPSLEEGNNYRWQADLGIEFPVWKYINFKINYLQTFESLVIADQKREDQFLTFGFTIKNFK